ncbi:predicted protein [Histoplasma capsulatum var. duboisii H88]|uniref:Predicted protein n=1 Tax=Ajellomyces capsulatus (strain H88) TaxID=544711 RepID=F0UAI8_AJEC8|nr:predicted protein [Histoplasma capsulatum var. duboisii H88]
MNGEERTEERPKDKSVGLATALSTSSGGSVEEKQEEKWKQRQRREHRGTATSKRPLRWGEKEREREREREKGRQEEREEEKRKRRKTKDELRALPILASPASSRTGLSRRAPSPDPRVPPGDLPVPPFAHQSRGTCQVAGSPLLAGPGSGAEPSSYEASLRGHIQPIISRGGGGGGWRTRMQTRQTGISPAQVD